MTSLINLNKEMENTMKAVKSLEESGLLIKDVGETIKNEAKEPRGIFLPILLDILAASLLEVY